MISHWSSLEAANPQGTLSMRAFAYYDLWLKFKVEGAGVGEHYADLKWKSGASAMQSVPSSSLFEVCVLWGCLGCVSSRLFEVCVCVL